MNDRRLNVGDAVCPFNRKKHCSVPEITGKVISVGSGDLNRVRVLWDESGQLEDLDTNCLSKVVT
jgi:hypothetical protein